MRIFISWSGERSKTLAVALRDWLPLIVHYVEPWLSEADIEAGDRWAQSVAEELAAANFGIVCVTSENVNAPWVLFEAGALAKTLQTSKVIPLLLDLELSDISGPLAQFQAKKAIEHGLHEIIHSIQASAEAPVPEQRENQLFEALWPQLEQKITDIPRGSPSARHARPQQEVLEELVASVRAIETRSARSDDAMADLLSSRREIARIADFMGQTSELPLIQRRLEATIAELTARIAQLSDFWTEAPGSRRDLDAIHQIIDMIAPEKDNPIRLVIWASILRQQMPWLYDLSLDVYGQRVARQDTSRSLRALKVFLDRTRELAPAAEKLGIGPKTLSHAIRQMSDVVDQMSGAPE